MLAMNTTAEKERKAAAVESDPLVLPVSSEDGANKRSFWSIYETFGHELMVLLFFTQHLLKGFCSVLITKSTPYMFKSYAVPAPAAQIYTSVAALPWALKPIIGLVSDLYPIGGYNKAPYVIMVSCLGSLAMAVSAFTPQSSLPLGWFVACLFSVTLLISTADLLSEAKYAERMQTKPQHGPGLLSYVWFGATFGGLVATLVSGPVIGHFGPRALLAAAAVPAAAVMWPVMQGYFKEKYVDSEALVAMRARYWEQREACFLCFLMLACTLAIIVCSMISREPLPNAIVAVVVGVVALVSSSILLSPVVARANAFALLQASLSWSIAGASFYFYTDSPRQYPDGPHFSPFFYNTVLGTIGSVLSLLGVCFYNRYMASWKYRSMIIFTNVLIAGFSLIDVMFFARITKQYGIPDHAVVIGLSVFESIAQTWQWMPQVVILSYLCPRGMEATMYALLAGCHNMGNNIALNCGALLLHYLGCSPSGANGESEQFDNLWKASLVAATLPFFSTLLTVRLLPDAQQDERIDGVEGATQGSLWRCWRDL